MSPTRPPPAPNEERAHLTVKLIAERGTDTQRWASMENLATQWDARAALAADWIPHGSRVLDIGAGAMALENMLKSGCAYQPADVVRRRPDCVIADLNKGEFPTGKFDVITFLGVLEYVHDIDWPLDRARESGVRMIVTYCAQDGGDVSVRRGMGWVNDLTVTEFEAALQRNGWRIEQRREIKRGPANIQYMFDCARADLPGPGP